ncbi:MAG: translation initiation factor IF-2, partial [Actinobacteria bacterium]|nr:translation initiation factor IF-2 [Actinomycetota bacterium]
MAKLRVYELAKDLGLESKELLAKLQEVGEFVRSASSTVEAPVVRKLMDKFPDLKAVADAAPAEAKPAKKAAAKKSAAKKAAAPTPEEIAAALASLDEGTRAQIEEAQAAIPVAPVTPVPPITPVNPASSAASSATNMPRPPAAGNNPFSAGNATNMPRPPRAGNNPFSAGSAVPRPPAQRPLRPGERPPMSGARPGSVRPGFAARPQGARPGGAPGTGAPRPSGPGGASGAPQSPYRTPNAGGPGGAAPGNNFGPNKGGGRHQRGGTAGAFGKQGGKSRKAHKSKKALREEFDNMAAPSLGGAVIPHGDGKTPIRLRRGATLMDFAEKIGGDPAALVSALFHLGEMVTATQSVDEDTFMLLGAELGYIIQVVSP